MGRKRFKSFEAQMKIEAAASDGRAIARHEGQVIFIKYGVPGDEAIVHVFKKEKKSLVGEIKEIITPSEDRISPVCNHFGLCGGCKWQMMDYTAQLFFKQQQVSDALERIAKVPIGEVLPIIGAEKEYEYRNKLEYSFSHKGWIEKERLEKEAEIEWRALGFFIPGRFDKVVNIDLCHLQGGLPNAIRNAIRDFCIAQGYSFYDIRAREGFLRNVMFRLNSDHSQLMVALVVGEDKQEYIDQIFEYLADKFPQISSLGWIYSQKLNSSFSDLPFRLWKGNEYIVERLGVFQFKISPTSFFQTNTHQALNLYEVVRNWLKEIIPDGQEQHELVYDLYAGTGSIGIFVSSLARKIVGIEYVEAAISDAWENVAFNQLDHFSFYAGDMKEILNEELLSSEGVPSVIITDPPRQGMDPKVIRKILDIHPQHIIYVSCKPSTQARDIQLLSEKYDLIRSQAVDMFPQTAHVENIVLLKLREGK